jgi:hypothetical protein
MTSVSLRRTLGVGAVRGEPLGQRGLGSERGEHVQVPVVEAAAAGAVRDDQHPGRDSAGCDERSGRSRAEVGRPVIRVAGGAKLAAVTGDSVVAIQADELTEISGTWLQQWANGRRDHFVRIQVEEVAGRRMRSSVSPSV